MALAGRILNVCVNCEWSRLSHYPLQWECEFPTGHVNGSICSVEWGGETKAAHRPSCSVSTILACLNPDNQPCSFMSDGHFIFILQIVKNGWISQHDFPLRNLNKTLSSVRDAGGGLRIPVSSTSHQILIICSLFVFIFALLLGGCATVSHRNFGSLES